MKTANAILDRYAGRVATRRAVCEAGLTARMPSLLAEFLPPGRWLLVADANTMDAQGEALLAGLRAAGRPTDVLLLKSSAGHKDLVCESSLVERVKDAIGSSAASGITEGGGGISAVIAVGSGTICDTVKLAAEAAGLPAAAVATAASMNGYPSGIAAVLREGVKRTDPTRPPVVVLADLDVLAAAPRRMTAAGLADLLAKPVSTADWTLAHALLGDPLDEECEELVETSARLGAGLAADLAAGQPQAVGRLFEALFVSGVVMAVAGASRPISGAEHLISHYLDMTSLANGWPHDLHGLQVGVGTRATAGLYRRLLAWDPRSVDIPGRVAAQPPWPTVESDLRGHFGPTLADAVIGQARMLHAEGDLLARRLDRFQAIFPDLRGQLAARLTSAAQIESELRACGAATRFEQIGVDRVRARQAILYARFVRARYTVLHLLADLGVLQEWTDTTLAEMND